MAPPLPPSSGKFIRIRGAREHNLKNVSVEIPRDQLVVITGLSGSGKSTLAFDTVFAEGQRKYMESLSTYARQFLDQLQKPDIDEIEGLPPTIAIEQRSASHNPRSTVATTTEIYDYLRVLFARAGTPHCYKCGKPIAGQTSTQIIDSVMQLPAGSKLMVLAPIVRGQKGEHKEVFALMHKQGYVRARIDGVVTELGSPDKPPELKKTFAHKIEAVLDRIILKPEVRPRLADSIEAALKLAQGLVIIAVAEAGSADKWTDTLYSERLACPDHPEVSLGELEPRLFSFNSPHGACPTCHGLGVTSEFDPDLIIPDDSVALQQGAIEPWRKNGPRMNIWYSRVLRTFCRDFGIDYASPIASASKKVRDILLYGTEAKGDNGTGTEFEGVVPNLHRRYENTESEFVRHKLFGYMSEQPCETCGGARLKKEALAVRLHSDVTVDSAQPIEARKALSTTATAKSKAKAAETEQVEPPVKLPGLSIDDVVRMTVLKAREFFRNLKLSAEGTKIAEPIMREIGARLGFMADVGLGYLTLTRRTGSLSGGEAQRIRLATQVGSGLVGVCYVLDEPTIGLHQRDNTRLLATLRRLQQIGNTVLIVEHDEDCIRGADYLIDIGPGAGRNGGEVVAAGPMPEVLKQTKSLTVQYIVGEKAIHAPKHRRKVRMEGSLQLIGCTANNLKNVSISIPLGSANSAGALICITGVSGSGKSTLINQTLLPALKRKIYNSKVKPGQYKELKNAGKIDKVIEIDQSPIGRTPRSNPATYTGVFDDIRKVFAATREAKLRGYEMGRFSFNVKGGRCEACQGQGIKTIEMHFLPDVHVACESCHGTRYNAETLEISYRGKNIAQVLDMTVEEALPFFDSHPKIKQVVQTLVDVGLTYVKLGQPSTQLSGGEAQRIKLATELGKSATGHTMYVLDEPTTGLHFQDVANLLAVLNRLADAGNTVLVIEHNLDVIKCADWLIDMGPEGGDAGGTVIAVGTPEEVARTPSSYTGEYLRRYVLPAGELEQEQGSDNVPARADSAVKATVARAKAPRKTAAAGTK